MSPVVEDVDRPDEKPCVIIKLVKSNRLALILFAAAILFSMVREWSVAILMRANRRSSAGVPACPLADDPDPPPVLSVPLQRNLHIPLAIEARKFLSPLNQQNASLRAQIIQPQRLQLTLRIDAVKINVIIDRRAVHDIRESK